MPAKSIEMQRASAKPRREVPMASAPQLPTKGFIREAQLIPTFVPFSSATLWRKVKSGDFPRPVKLSERVTAWRLEDVHAWLGSF